MSTRFVASIGTLLCAATFALSLAAPAVAAPPPDAIALRWVGERNGVLTRLFESDPVAVVSVAGGGVVQVKVFADAIQVGQVTVKEGSPVELPVAVLGGRASGQPLTLLVRAIASDGSATEKTFGPVELAQAMPQPLTSLRWKWASRARIRLDWGFAAGDAPAAHVVIRRGRAVLARLNASVRFYRVANNCAADQTYSIVPVSANGDEGTPATVTIPAGSCPKR